MPRCPPVDTGPGTEALRARRFYTPSRSGEEAELSGRSEAIQRQLAERKPREPGEEG